MNFSWKSLIIKAMVALAISVLLLWFFFRQFSFDRFIEISKGYRLSLVIFAGVLYLFTHFARTARFKFLLEQLVKQKLGWKNMFFLVCTHNMLLGLLPFRSGELSFPYLLKKQDIRISHSLSSLALARIFDVLTLCIFFLIGVLIWFDYLPDLIRFIIPYTFILIGVIIFIMLMIVWKAHALVLWAKKRNPDGKIYGYLCHLEELVKSYKQLNSSKVFLFLFLFTIPIWIFQFLWTWILFGPILKVGFWKIVLGSSVPIIATSLPIQGLVGFGPLEWGWALAFLALGVPKELAYPTSLSFHLFNILYFVTLGIIGVIGMNYGGKVK